MYFRLTDLCFYCENGIELKKNIATLKEFHGFDQNASLETMNLFFRGKALDQDFNIEVRKEVLQKLNGNNANKFIP